MERSIDYDRRVAPWSGLGTDISGCSTVNDALWEAGLDWTVEQRPIQTMVPNQIVIPGFKANIRTYDDEVLGIVTDRYKVIQNEEAFSFVDSLVDEGVQFQKAGQFQGGRKVWILAKLPERYVIADESVSPFVVFITSHDGSGSVKAAMTPVRVICSNMLNLALRRASRTWSAQHTGDIARKLDDARDTLLNAGTYMTELSNEIENLSLQRLTDYDISNIIEQLIPVTDALTDAQIRNITQRRADLLERYHHAPDLSVLPKSAARFLQAVSDHATHMDPIRMTANYRENLFAKSVEGNSLIDRAYALVKAV